MIFPKCSSLAPVDLTWVSLAALSYRAAPGRARLRVWPARRGLPTKLSLKRECVCPGLRVR
jgi:hypothetical protein